MLETVAISAIIVALAVLIHFEMLRQLSRIIPKMATMLRFRVLCALFGALIAHIVEVQLFAMGYYAMTHFPWPDMVNFGTVVNSAGEATVTLRDCSYFSFVSYTTLGFGEIIPVGHIRFLSGLEALTGLVLVAWTASFMYVEMESYWRKT